MSAVRYLIRLDDACPTMSGMKWTKMEILLDKYGIKPMVGIVPDNHDAKLNIEPADASFWDKSLEWQNKGWVIALHGYDHVYHQSKGGLNPLWNRSEFVGLPFEEQKDKLSRGMKILKEHNLHVKYFFAPSHTFDKTTVDALLSLGITRISDTIALNPYKMGAMIYIPQIGGKCRKMSLSGVYTFCFHPNIMSDKDFDDLEAFLSRYQQQFTEFAKLDFDQVGNLGLISRFLRFMYFLRRRTKH